VLEPGARILMGGGVLRFTGHSKITLDPITDPDNLVGVNTSTNDDSRVRLSGSGNVIMADDALMFVGTRTNFGVETFFPCDPTTTITWTLNDQAKIQIGNESSEGGVFQVGNTFQPEFLTRDAIPDSVNFTLNIDGPGAEFRIDRQGMLGLGAGIVDKLSPIPNEWVIGSLFFVGEINVLIPQGTFVHNQIFTGNSPRASLFAIGGGGNAVFNWDFNVPNALIPAGGNLYHVEPGAPVVPLVDIISDDNAAIMSSRDLLIEPGHVATTVNTNATPAQIFTYLSTIPYQQQLAKLSNIAQEDIGQEILGYVRTVAGTNFIFRPTVFRIEGGGNAQPVDPQQSVERGAVGINIQDSNGNINNLQELVGP